MLKTVVRSAGLAAVLGLSLFAIGCEAPGVGDPCLPESIPAGGFRDSEAYIETSSVQCRTRVCMVYRLAGDPSPDCGGVAGVVCPSDQEIRDRVYCTCRCDGPADSTTSFCECPEGFSCEPVLELGGAGIRGSYCVRSNTIVE